ncbi:type II toxin-antitoxin system RelE/ParE family toxin, partial [Planctomycetota bacterium]
MSHLLTMKPGFLAEWSALTPKIGQQVMGKLQVLLKDPHPDGHAKKKLKHLDSKLHRLRSGDYRVFYTFDDNCVSV